MTVQPPMVARTEHDAANAASPPAVNAGSEAVRDALRAADAFGTLAKAELSLAISLIARVAVAIFAAVLLLPAFLWFALAGALRLLEEWGLSPGSARMLLAAVCIVAFFVLLRQARRWLDASAMPATRRQLRRLIEGIAS